MNRQEFSFKTSIYKNNVYYKDFDFPWLTCTDLIVGDMLGHYTSSTTYDLVVSLPNRSDVVNLSERYSSRQT